MRLTLSILALACAAAHAQVTYIDLNSLDPLADPAASDRFYVDDVSDLSESAEGTGKHILWSTIVGAVEDDMSLSNASGIVTGLFGFSAGVPTDVDTLTEVDALLGLTSGGTAIVTKVDSSQTTNQLTLWNASGNLNESGIDTNGSGVLTSPDIVLGTPDPGADFIVLWDDSDDDMEGALIGSGLSYDGTTLSATGGGTTLTIEDEGAQVGDADIALLDFEDGHFVVTEPTDTEIGVTLNASGPGPEVVTMHNGSQTAGNLIEWQADGDVNDSGFTPEALRDVPWVDGTPVLLADTGDEVEIGPTLAGAAKLTVHGDADEPQLFIQGNGTQTSDLITAEQSDGTDVFNLNNDGDLDIAGDLAVTGTSTFGTLDVTGALSAGSLEFEGATADDYETSVAVVDPTADRTFTLPDASGTAAFERAYDYIWIDAGAMVPQTTSGAEADTNEYATEDIMADRLLFDGSSAEHAQWKLVLPPHWDAGTVKVKIYWDADTGASAADTVEWEVAAAARANDDAIDDTWGTAVTVGDTVIAVGDVHITAASGAITIGNTPAVDDLIWFKIQRDPAGTDDMTEDAALLGVMLEYAVNNTTNSGW